MRPVLAALLFAPALYSAAPVLAQPAEPEAVIERLFTTDALEESWFAPSFLSALPLGEVETFIKSYVEQYGSFQSVSGGGSEFVIELEKADVPALLALDQEGRIAGLRLQEAIPRASLEEHEEAIKGLPGETALLVISGGEDKAAHNADMRLAVGSAAKLAILKAATDAVAEGRLSWEQTFELDEAWRSLPSGILQDWPTGAPLTLSTLANLMVSLSDNTATDAMIHLVGREAVERITPENTPFLTTRELFTLKTEENAELYEKWASGDAARHSDLLPSLGNVPLPRAGDLAAQPTLKAEWYFSARELCQLMEELKDQSALSINPGLASRDEWEKIAYKGGSDVGVLNFTTRLEGADGSSHCVVATWNSDDQALDDRRLASTYRGLLHSLSGE